MLMDVFILFVIVSLSPSSIVVGLKNSPTLIRTKSKKALRVYSLDSLSSFFWLLREIFFFFSHQQRIFFSSFHMLIHIQHETECTFYDNLKFEINYDSSEGKKFKHLKWIYVARMVRLSESSDVNLSNGFLFLSTRT